MKRGRSEFDPGACLFENRVRWAVTSLSKAELAELVGPSTVRISDDGRAVLETDEQIDRDFLLRTRPSYAAWHVDMGVEEPKPAEAGGRRGSVDGTRRSRRSLRAAVHHAVGGDRWMG